MVLDAVSELLKGCRLEDVSMSAIARQAGMSKRTLYTIFASREELLGVTFARIGQALFRPLDESERGLPLVERLRTLLTVGQVPIFESAPLEVLRAVVSEAPIYPGIAEQLDAEGRGALIRYVGDELALAATAGELTLRGMTAHEAAELLVDMVMGDTLHRLLTPETPCGGPEGHRLRRDRALAIFLDGLRPR